MKPKQILIVDDKPTLADRLAEALKSSSLDYQIILAYSGEKALEWLHRSTLDLLITDLHMPGIGGLDLIRWVRAFYPDMPTLLVTAGADETVAQKARSHGAWGFITKPFDLDLFVETVCSILHSSGEHAM
jgi:two-component system response regulator YesN